MRAKWESESWGIFVSDWFGFSVFWFFACYVQGLNGNRNTRQHFVARGQWVVLSRVMISVFLIFVLNFFFVFCLMKCMRFRLSAGVSSALKCCEHFWLPDWHT